MLSAPSNWPRLLRLPTSTESVVTAFPLKPVAVLVVVVLVVVVPAIAGVGLATSWDGASPVRRMIRSAPERHPVVSPEAVLREERACSGKSPPPVAVQLLIAVWVSEELVLIV